MSKYLFLLFFLCQINKLDAQVRPEYIYSVQFKFKDKAPKPWSIDGKVNDWKIIAGKYSGDNNRPFNVSDQGSNWMYDNVTPLEDPENPGLKGDLDDPDPKLDFNFFSYVNDDYNVYYYFRLLNQPEQENSFFYFFDISNDGLMGEGEPVIGATFTNQKITDLSLYRFIPNLEEDYEEFVGDKGNLMTDPSSSNCKTDGYSIKGTLEKIILPQHALGRKELFAAAVTEEGLGVELSIPWKFLKNWSTNTSPLGPGQGFSYHVSLQKGVGSYSPEKVTENGDNGSWPEDSPALFYSSEILYSSRGEILTDKTLRFHISFQSSFSDWPTYLDSVTIKDIQQTNGIPVDNEKLEQFTVNVYEDLNCNGALEIEEKTVFDPPVFDIQFSEGEIKIKNIIESCSNPDIFSAKTSICFIIDVSPPQDFNATIQSADLRYAPWLCFTPLSDCQRHDRGKPIPPISFDRPIIFFGINSGTASENGTVQKEDHLSEEVSVVPNPNTGKAIINLPTYIGKADIILSDISGRILQRWSSITSKTMQLYDLKPGFYFLNIYYQNGTRKVVKKLIVQ